MDLVLEVRTGRENVTMACRGKLVGGKEVEAFRRNALLLLGGFNKLIVNLTAVRALDVDGLGSLMSVLAHAVDNGKQLQIIAPSTQSAVQMFNGTILERFLVREKCPRPQLVAKSCEAIA
ncbi:MAG: hypothetical protein CXZ00_13250 [Acidobacteria bacterium]|nr:MAG: hypothetical protein CXZ00_13250 [Acidobacteriota bacterium]